MRRAWFSGLLLLAMLTGCGSPVVSEPVESTAATFGIVESAFESGPSDSIAAPVSEPEEPAAEPSDEILIQEPFDEPEETEDSENVENTMKTEAIYAEINGQRFSVTLDDSPTAEAFRELLPAAWEMEELHGNEKFIYLDGSLPSDSRSVGYIETGDLMLYSDNCVVLFYDSFSTSYGYTRIGWVDNPEGLAEAVGSGDIIAVLGLE